MPCTWESLTVGNFDGKCTTIIECLGRKSLKRMDRFNLKDRVNHEWFTKFAKFFLL